jgi:hypothetical protein
MIDALSYAPITAGVDATSTEWNSYTGGIIAGTQCSTTPTNFVLIIGWGNDSVAGDFWYVKSSVFTGSGGYVMVAIDYSSTSSSTGVCGI